MFCVIILVSVVTAAFTVAVEYGFIYLLSETFGFDMFGCFYKDKWRENPLQSLIISLVWLIAITFLIAAVASVFMGKIPFGDNYESEQWEPAL